MTMGSVVTPVWSEGSQVSEGGMTEATGERWALNVYADVAPEAGCIPVRSLAEWARVWFLTTVGTFVGSEE